MFLKYPGMVLHLALTWQVKILGFSIWDETCSIAQKFNLAVHHSYQNKLWSLSIPFIFWAKSEVVVAEVTIHYLQLFHYVATVVTVWGWPLQTILDTILKRPQLLANLQNGPSRKHFIRRRRILIAINAINVEETQPHCVHSLKKGGTSQHFPIFVHRAWISQFFVSKNIYTIYTHAAHIMPVKISRYLWRVDFLRQ